MISFLPKHKLLQFLLLLTVFLSACKSDSTTKAEDGIQENAIDLTVPVRIGVLNNPVSMVPFLTTSGANNDIIRYMNPEIIRFDPESGALTPYMLKSIPTQKVINEGEYKGGLETTYEFKEEVQWSDGVPLTAKDYLFTLKTIFNPNSKAAPWRSVLNFIDDIILDETNPKKFTVKTKEKYINALVNAVGIPMLPKHILDPEDILENYNYKDLHNTNNSKKYLKDSKLQQVNALLENPDFVQGIKNIPGLGAYELMAWERGIQLVLKKRKNWWGDQFVEKDPLFAAYPDKIIYKFIPDETSRLGKLQTQEIDILPRITPVKFEEIKKNELIAKNYNFYNPAVPQVYYYSLNNHNPKLQDKRVRRALAHIVNLEKGLDLAMYGNGKMAVGPVFYEKEYFNKDLKPITYDLEKAKTILAEAGWKDTNGNGILDKVIEGQQVELELEMKLSSSSVTGRTLSTIFKEEAEKVGVEINIVNRESGTMFKEIKSGDYEMSTLVMRSSEGLFDPTQYWHTSSDNPMGNNSFGFGNQESDALIDDIIGELEETKRNKMYNEFQKMIYDEQPVIFLFYPREGIAVHKKFKDLMITSQRPGYFLNYFKPTKYSEN